MTSNHRQARRACITTMVLTILAAVFMFAEAAVPARAQTPTLLYTFQGTTADACAPLGNIVQGRDGNMYGGGAACGATGAGAIYKITPAGVESVLYNFPQQWLFCGGAGLTLGNDGNFYGVCESGNPDTRLGSIFRLTPAGVFTDLHDFTGADGDAVPVYPPMQASDGNFYGVSGNEVQYCGNVYQMTPAGVYTNLHSFSDSDCHSSNLFQASDGNLYGTLANCSVVQSAGCVYKISTCGRFQGNLRLHVRDRPNSMYWNDPGQGWEAVWGHERGSGKWLGKYLQADLQPEWRRISTTSPRRPMRLASNNAGPPVNLLQVADGSFYGVNPAYGANGTGSIYKLTSAGVFSAFLFPNPPVEGQTPSSTLIQHTNGRVYGTTPSGGGGSGGCPQLVRRHILQREYRRCGLCKPGAHREDRAT